MEPVTAAAVNAVQQAAKQLSCQLLRHGGAALLTQDVLRSASAWLPSAGVAALRQQLCAPGPSQVPPSAASAAPAAVLGPLPEPLAGQRLDAALHTLRLLNQRLDALSSMAHEPASCSSTQGVSVSAEAWLVAHKAAVQQRGDPRHSWQYGYELTLTNTSREPLQLMRKAWAVQDINGDRRYRESEGLMGLQPTIQPDAELRCRTAITLGAIKGSMHGHLELRGLSSGRTLLAHVGAFALTPTAAQMRDPQITSFGLG